MTQQEMKDWVDNASYDELLSKWRFAPVDDPFFRADTGITDYYSNAMSIKRAATYDNGVAASKRVGRDR
jgi:hypothetical protein